MLVLAYWIVGVGADAGRAGGAKTANKDSIACSPVAPGDVGRSANTTVARRLQFKPVDVVTMNGQTSCRWMGETSRSPALKKSVTLRSEASI